MGKTEKKPAVQMISALLTGAGAALVLCVLILLLCSGGILWGWFQLSTGKQLGLIACALAAFAGGLIAVRRAKRWALPVGFGTGALFGLLLLLLAAFLVEDAAFDARSLPVLLICLCAGGVAGLMGKKRKKRRF